MKGPGGEGKAGDSPSQDPSSSIDASGAAGAGTGAETPHLGEFESFLNTASDNGASEAMFEQHVGQIAQQTHDGRQSSGLGELDPALSK
jgi:hypothetical protein